MSRTATRPAHSTPAANSTNHAPDRPDSGVRPEAYETHTEARAAPTPTPHRTLSELFFRPFPELPPEWQSPKAQDTLLREYVNHRGNFADFALDRGISIDQLYDWLHSEQVIEKCKRLEAMANRQSALLATLIRPDALKALADVIISPDSTPSQRRLAASAVLRACDKLNRPAESTKRARSRQRSDPSNPSPSSPGVVLPVNVLQSGPVDMGVDLSRRDVGVPQQLLHHAEVGAPDQQVRGKAVPQHVRMDMAEPRGGRVALDDLPHSNALDGAPCP